MAASKPVSSDDRALQSAGNPAFADRIGQTLAGKWTLQRFLGSGGSACVYAARHRNGRQVAVKVLHGDLSRHERAARRFLSEGYAANKVAHPGVVQILDDGKDEDGTLFLVMELLEGQSLAQRFEAEGALSPDEVIEAAVGILDVLATAHDVGIIHRDVKPSNVFKTRTETIKLLDFGAARMREADDFVTRSGTTLGTPAFMAPELAAGRVEEIDGRTDVWSVGATMFQLLTGRTVHAGRSANEALVTAATRPVQPIASIRPDLAPAVAAVIDRALAFDKSARWPNARAMQAELIAAQPSAAAQRVLEESSTASLPESTRMRDRRRPHPWMTFAICAAAAAAFAAIALGGSRVFHKAAFELRRDFPAPSPTIPASSVAAPFASESGVVMETDHSRPDIVDKGQPPHRTPAPARRALDPAPDRARDDGLDSLLDRRK